MMKTGTYWVSMQPMKNKHYNSVYVLLVLPMRAGTVKLMSMT